MEHTPGPWDATRLMPDGNIITRSGFEICTPEYDVCAYIPHGGPIRNAADARLIAASPDLLNACERAAGGYRTIIRLLDSRMPKWREAYCFEAGLEELEQAIEAATGSRTDPSLARAQDTGGASAISAAEDTEED